MLVLDINAHGIPNGRPAEFYEGLSQGELKDYRSIGRARREDCYFKGMFLRMIRGIDFLTAQPEWDGRTVIVYGSSQGGFRHSLRLDWIRESPSFVRVFQQVATIPAMLLIESVGGRRSCRSTPKEYRIRL